MLSAAAVLLPGCASLLPGLTWRVSRPRAAVRHGSVLAIEADMKDYVRPSGAPEVRAIDGLSDPNKPVLLYLPGIELSGYTLHPQTQELSEDFALHYLTVGQDDRTSFDGLVDVVCDAIDRLANEPVAAAAAAAAAGSGLGPHEGAEDVERGLSIAPLHVVREHALPVAADRGVVQQLLRLAVRRDERVGGAAVEVLPPVGKESAELTRHRRLTLRPRPPCRVDGVQVHLAQPGADHRELRRVALVDRVKLVEQEDAQRRPPARLGRGRARQVTRRVARGVRTGVGERGVGVRAVVCGLWVCGVRVSGVGVEVQPALRKRSATASKERRVLAYLSAARSYAPRSNSWSACAVSTRSRCARSEQ